MLQKYVIASAIISTILILNFVEATHQGEPSNCTFRVDEAFDRVYAESSEPIDYIPPDLICIRSTPSEFLNELKKHKDKINDIKCDTCGIDDLDTVDKIQKLKHIRSIDWVNQTLKPNFRKLDNVEQIYLKKNNIEFTNELFQGVTFLKIIHIYLNYAEELPEDLFMANPNLQVIVISRCKIRVIPAEIFRNLDDLLVVNLRQNQISELPQNLFIQNTKLKILNLSYNRIMSIEKKFVEHLKNLKELYLTGNPIYEIALEPIFSLDLHIFHVDYLPCVTLRDKLIPFCKFKRQCEWDECQWEEKSCLYYKPDPKGDKRIALAQVTTEEDSDTLKDQWIESHVDGIVCIDYCGENLNYVPEHVDYLNLMQMFDALNRTLNLMLKKHVFTVPALAAQEDLNEIKKLIPS